MASFKVPCPSCEAPVLIKNPSLVGTKVECPKCKYRFTVEKPAETGSPAGAAGAAGAGDARVKPAAAKGKAAPAPGKGKKLVPLVVGVLAVLVLGGVGFAVLGGKGKPKGNPFDQVGKGRGGSQGEGDGDGEKPPEDNKKGPVVPAIPPSDKVTTNLLPGDARTVIKVNVPRVVGTPAYEAIVDDAVVQMFQETLGFTPTDAETFVHCFAGPEREPFGVVKLKTPANVTDTLRRMPVQAKPQVIGKFNLYAFRTNPLLTAVSHAMSFRSLLGDLYQKLPEAAKEPPARPFGVCVYDTQHVLIGDYKLVEAFLRGVGPSGYPTFKSEFVDSRGGSQPKETPKGPPANEPEGGRVYTRVNSYLSLANTTLKDQLDAQEQDRPVPPAVVFAEAFAPDRYAITQGNFKKENQNLAAVLEPVAASLRYVSGSVTTFARDRTVANLRLTFDSANEARELATEKVGPTLGTLADVLRLALFSWVDLRDYVANPTLSVTPPGGMYPGGMTPGGMYPGGMTPGGMPGVPQPPRGGRDGEEGPGTTPGTTPGTQPPKEEVRSSFIELRQLDNHLLVGFDLTYPEPRFRDFIEPRLRAVTNPIKGKMAVFS
ncbi:MAG: hypothetical protein K2V38_19405, partial [Gemmataceae bacterium]|nr:hypothetical protein [Gemmataceae bacterium]